MRFRTLTLAQLDRWRSYMDSLYICLLEKCHEVILYEKKYVTVCWGRLPPPVLLETLDLEGITLLLLYLLSEPCFTECLITLCG